MWEDLEREEFSYGRRFSSLEPDPLEPDPREQARLAELLALLESLPPPPDEAMRRIHERQLYPDARWHDVPTHRFDLYEWLDSVVYATVAVVLVLSFAFRMIGVIGASMEPTLHEQERVLMVNPIRSPRQGDVVVFDKLKEPYVKRVIATAGQTVDIDFLTCEVRVDGVLLDEPYINEPTRRREDVTFPLTVPEGHVFVMGDNRNHSSDSRSSAIGCVDTRMIIGRVTCRLLPLEAFGKIENPYD